MRVTVVFRHSKASKVKYLSPSTFHFDRTSSQGPVMMRGDAWGSDFDLKDGDVVEFSTTKYDDEPSLKVWRGKTLLNSPKGRKK